MTPVERSDAQATFEFIAEHTRDVIVRVDSQGRVTYASPSIRAYGYEPEALIGATGLDLLHPDDRERFAANTAALLRDETQVAVNREHRIRTANGDWVWVEGAPKVVRDDDGRPTGVVNVFRDVSERRAAEAAVRESEARYRLIAENTFDMIVITGLDGRIAYLSHSARRTGFEPEDLVGRPFGEHFHPDDAKAVSRVFGRLLSSGMTERVRWRGRHGQHGGWMWLESNPTLLRDPDTGAPTGFLDVVRDIGLQVKTEEALAVARAAAEAATAVKSQFLANMSHEIRTPLTAVLGFASLLRQQPNLDGPAQDYVKRISGAGAALLTIVNDLLDFSKLEAGMVEIRPRPTDIAELAREALSLFAEQAAGKGLTLRIEAHPDLPAAVMVDGDRLRQILINLTGNAVKFTAQGGVTLQVAPASGDSAWRFEVQDTGAGLDADQCARLFQRFSQVEGAVGHGGTGLGLAICRALTEAMGGEIGVTSTPGRGSIFHVTLPGLTVEAASGLSEADDDSLPILGTRVYVVDDNGMNRELARGMLEALGAEVTESGSGHEALEQLALTPVDVMLLDLRMPIMGGVELLRRLRAQDGPNRYVPALAFTADADIGSRGELEGFEGVVRKPISVSELAAVVAAATDWRTTADRYLLAAG